MGAVDHNLRNFNPVTREGCKFLVHGELKKNITKGLGPSIDDLKSVVALENIWLHDGIPLLRLHNVNGKKNTIKDLTLAFALSRLLRCRIEGGRLHEDTISMTKELICSRIISANDYANNVLAGILQMELSFLGEHIHTGYHMVFCQGLRSLYFPALQFVAQLTCFVWFLADMDSAIIGGEIPLENIADKFITVQAIVVLLVMEIFEVFKYMKSNWTILLLACNYVNCRSNKRMEQVFERLLLSVPSSSNNLEVSFSSRYDFLQSSSYSEGKLRLHSPVFTNWSCCKLQRCDTCSHSGASPLHERRGQSTADAPPSLSPCK